MKKICLIIISIMFIIPLFSCNDCRLINIDNVIWKEETFQIETTSEQLQNQSKIIPGEQGDKDYYSSITIEFIKYNCVISLSNNHFAVLLYDATDNEMIDFYSSNNNEDKNYTFIEGGYSPAKPKKQKGKDYIYIFYVSLKTNGSYYEYCMDNNIEYPKTLTFYGYENK